MYNDQRVTMERILHSGAALTGTRPHPPPIGVIVASRTLLYDTNSLLSVRGALIYHFPAHQSSYSMNVVREKWLESPTQPCH